jgi:anti-sigma B factor antagonist
MGRDHQVIPSDLPLGADNAEFDALRLTVRSRGPAVILEASGEVDLVTSSQLQDAITAVLADDPEVVVADLSAVTLLDSSGLRVLISAHRSAASATRFAVVTGGSATRKPLQLTGLDREIAVFGSLDTALTAGC